MTESSGEFCVVLTTTNSEENARAIVDVVLSRRLGACVQTMPISSHYVWQGANVEDREVLMLVKAKIADYEDLERAIHEVHTYEVPEVIRLPIAGGSWSYFDWMRTVTRPTEP